MNIAAREHLGCAFEAVSLAQDGIDDVDLDRGIGGEVGNRVRGVDVQEHEVLVVPHGCRALRRQVGGSVGAHRGDEPETLLTNDAAHVVIESHHYLLAPAGTHPAVKPVVEDAILPVVRTVDRAGGSTEVGCGRRRPPRGGRRQGCRGCAAQIRRPARGRRSAPEARDREPADRCLQTSIAAC